MVRRFIAIVFVVAILFSAMSVPTISAHTKYICYSTTTTDPVFGNSTTTKYCYYVTHTHSQDQSGGETTGG